MEPGSLDKKDVTARENIALRHIRFGELDFLVKAKVLWNGPYPCSKVVTL
jgi:hypothetical protein